MPDRRYKSGRRYPDADIIPDEGLRRYLFDLIDALSERDFNEIEIPINKTPYPASVSVGNLEVVVSTLLYDLRLAGVIKQDI